MDPSLRYKVRAPDDTRFQEVSRILHENAEVLLENAKRRTIAATGMDDATAERLRALDAEVVEDHQYDLD